MTRSFLGKRYMYIEWWYCIPLMALRIHKKTVCRSLKCGRLRIRTQDCRPAKGRRPPLNRRVRIPCLRPNLPPLLSSPPSKHKETIRKPSVSIVRYHEGKCNWCRVLLSKAPFPRIHPWKTFAFTPAHNYLLTQKWRYVADPEPKLNFFPSRNNELRLRLQLRLFSF